MIKFTDYLTYKARTLNRSFIYPMQGLLRNGAHVRTTLPRARWQQPPNLIADHHHISIVIYFHWLEVHSICEWWVILIRTVFLQKLYQMNRGSTTGPFPSSYSLILCGYCSRLMYMCIVNYSNIFDLCTYISASLLLFWSRFSIYYYYNIALRFVLKTRPI